MGKHLLNTNNSALVLYQVIVVLKTKREKKTKGETKCAGETRNCRRHSPNKYPDPEENSTQDDKRAPSCGSRGSVSGSVYHGRPAPAAVPGPEMGTAWWCGSKPHPTWCHFTDVLVRSPIRRQGRWSQVRCYRAGISSERTFPKHSGNGLSSPRFHLSSWKSWQQFACFAS